MDEVEQFERALLELGGLMRALEDLASSVVLIGGQVLALEARRRGHSGAIAVKTETGEELTRGFTLEPDLLFDIEGTEFMAGRLPEVLKGRGYERVRQYRWSRRLQGLLFHVDLFASDEVEPGDLPTAMVPLPDARLVIKRARPATFDIQGTSLRIALPDVVGFLMMKTRARLQLRAHSHKDSFDIVAYVDWWARMPSWTPWSRRSPRGEASGVGSESFSSRARHLAFWMSWPMPPPSSPSSGRCWPGTWWTCSRRSEVLRRLE